MKQKMLLYLFLMLTGNALNGQHLVKGRVCYVHDNESVIGCSVLKYDSTNMSEPKDAVYTGLDGEFAIMASPDDIFVFQFVGCHTEKIRVGNRKHIEVGLIEASNSGTINFGFTGQVIDEECNPIEDVEIRMAGSRLKRYSNYEGHFRFYTNGYKGTPKLTFRKDGYVKKTVKANLTGRINWMYDTPYFPVVVLERTTQQ